MLLKIKDTSVYDDVMRSAIHLPNGQTVFRCPYHGPMWGDAVQAPQHSCPHCWCLYFLKLEACTPPKDRERLMDNLLRTMKGAVRLAERGDFDIHIPRSPLHTEVILDPDDFKKE